MKVIRVQFPILLIILFEFAAGILLFIAPETFTHVLFVILGLLLIAIGALYVVRFFQHHKATGAWNWPVLIAAILAVGIGLVPAIAPNVLDGLFSVIAVVYGVFLLIAGVYKGSLFLYLRRAELPVSWLLAISAVSSVALGIVIVLHPFDSVVVLWRFTGVSLIVEAISDAISVWLARNR